MSRIAAFGSFIFGAVGAAAATFQIVSGMDNRPIESLEDIASALTVIADRVGNAPLSVDQQGVTAVDAAFSNLGAKVAAAAEASEVAIPANGLGVIRAGLLQVPLNETLLLSNGAGESIPFIITAETTASIQFVANNINGSTTKGSYAPIEIGNETCDLLYVRTNDDRLSVVLRLTCKPKGN